ncbi:hypothetical protein CKAH01_18727 [Colletotrichum kahawae]|uniref:Uncharacterized protein n=1 Tax=Colletotrichum kahawae TaxID=34407 RepID=A0AAE0D1U8_COLKA|nr:hypothetical protein CKAH01_18727 [Colletotrichum kahawae]
MSLSDHSPQTPKANIQCFRQTKVLWRQAVSTHGSTTLEKRPEEMLQDWRKIRVQYRPKQILQLRCIGATQESEFVAQNLLPRIQSFAKGK